MPVSQRLAPNPTCEAAHQLHCHRCVEADPVVRACVIPSLSRNCIAISAQARIGSSSAHFTSIALSPCSTRKWAALVDGGPSLRGLPAGGCGACPVVAIVPPGCGGGEGMVPGADGREPLDGGCGGCAKTTVANSAAATPKHRVDGFNTILSRQMAVAYPSLSTATSGSRSGERTGHRPADSCRACRWAAWAGRPGSHLEPVAQLCRQSDICRWPRLTAQRFSSEIVFLTMSSLARPRRGWRRHQERPTLPAQRTQWHSR